MALHDLTTGDKIVIDDVPTDVRLAVYLARGLPQKHDGTNLR